jgi:hypothetical protein
MEYISEKPSVNEAEYGLRYSTSVKRSESAGETLAYSRSIHYTSTAKLPNDAGYRVYGHVKIGNKSFHVIVYDMITSSMQYFTFIEVPTNLYYSINYTNIKTNVTSDALKTKLIESGFPANINISNLEISRRCFAV